MKMEKLEKIFTGLVDEGCTDFECQDEALHGLRDNKLVLTFRPRIRQVQVAKTNDRGNTYYATETQEFLEVLRPGQPAQELD